MSEVAIFQPQGGGSLAALAYLTDDQLNQQIALLQRAQSAVDRVKRSLMVKDIHFGEIPGTGKPTLLKPGAEVLLDAFRLVANPHVERHTGDGITEPHVSYVVRTTIHAGDIDGPVVGVGLGEANTFERKYRWRNGSKSCPSCGKASIGRSKEEYGGGYFCNRNNGGCGASFKKGSDGAKELDGQQSGPVENPDPFDLANTLLKMAAKRSLVSAALAATRSSDLFTQDLDETAPPHVQSAPSSPSPAPAAGAQQRAQAVLTSIADMTEAHKVRAKQLAADMGAEKLTVRSLLAKTEALDALEDWIRNGAELPVSAVPDPPTEPPASPPAAEPQTPPTVETIKDAFPGAFVEAAEMMARQPTAREQFPSAFGPNGERRSTTPTTPYNPDDDESPF